MLGITTVLSIALTHTGRLSPPLTPIARAPSLSCNRAGRIASAETTEAAEPPAAEEAADTVFTLSPRDDGWDDLRGAIVTARKERSGAWEQLQKQYVRPVSRVAKVVVEEVASVAPPVEGVKEVLDVAAKAPASLAAIRKGSTGKKLEPRDAVFAFADLLDRLAEKKQQRSGEGKPPVASTRQAAKAEAPSGKEVAVATYQVGALLAIPGLTLLYFVYSFVIN